MKKQVKGIKFDDLSPQMKRIHLAKDVIAKIKSERFIPTAGSYVWINADNLSRIEQKSFKTEYKKNKDIDCEVCALGALFCSYVLEKNKVSIKEMMNESSNPYITEKLAGIFSPEQLNLIEAFFEGWGDEISSNNGVWSDEALMFYEMYEDDTQRLILIMENIASNGGKFKPERLSMFATH